MVKIPTVSRYLKSLLALYEARFKGNLKTTQVQPPLKVGFLFRLGNSLSFLVLDGFEKEVRDLNEKTSIVGFFLIFQFFFLKGRPGFAFCSVGSVKIHHLFPGAPESWQM